MPPPGVLRGYDEVMPGLAKRIVDMTEKTITGHIDRDDKLADAEVRLATTGQIMAFVITLAALSAAIAFFAAGNAVAGIALTSLPVVLLVRSFLPSSGGQPLEPPQQPDPGAGSPPQA